MTTQNPIGPRSTSWPSGTSDAQTRHAEAVARGHAHGRRAAELEHADRHLGRQLRALADKLCVPEASEVLEVRDELYDLAAELAPKGTS